MQKRCWRKRRLLGAVVSCGMVLLGLTGCSRQPQVQQSMDTAMGTMIQQTVYTTDVDSDVTAEVIQCIDSLEKEDLSWRLDTSEVFRVNQSAGTEQGYQVSGELQAILETCQQVSEASEGAFDITIGEVTRLWDIDSWAAGEENAPYVIPTREELAQVLSETGYEKVQLADGRIFLPKDMQLDLGAVGKGIALDEVKEVLERHQEVTGAVISVGGSILTYGSKALDGDKAGSSKGENNWKVGVVDPFDTGSYLGILSLSGQWCVSTSGDYERYVEVNGVRYHHIMDPHTGSPADSGVKSVTILTKSGLYSDALSTACFVLGEEKGKALAEQFGAEALFVKENGEISMTEGMKQYFHLSNVEK